MKKLNQFNKWWKKHGIKFWMAIAFFGAYASYDANNLASEIMKTLIESQEISTRAIELAEGYKSSLIDCQNK